MDRLEKQGELASNPAYVFEFAAVRDEVAYEGECHILEHQGFVYWFFVFAPTPGDDDREEVQKEWENLRESFVLLDKRGGWTPRPRKSQTIAAAGVEMAFPLDVWKRVEENNPDDRSALMLHGMDPGAERGGEDSKAGKTATLHVVQLGKPDEKEPNKLLKDHFIAQQAAFLEKKVEEIELTTLTDSKGKPLEGKAKIGKVEGTITRGRLRASGGTFDRYVVLVTVPVGEGAVGIYFDSAFKYRDFWEIEIGSLLETFTPGK
jgi:hypothetical protein